jgi:hypothetical protein
LQPTPFKYLQVVVEPTQPLLDAKQFGFVVWVAAVLALVLELRQVTVVTVAIQHLAH